MSGLCRCLPSRQALTSSKAVLHNPAVVTVAAWHPPVPCLRRVAAIVLSRASPCAIPVVTLARAVTAALAATAAQATAATEEAATRRRTATGSFRPPTHRACPPAGVGTAIVRHASVGIAMVDDIAADAMATTGATMVSRCLRSPSIPDRGLPAVTTIMGSP